MNYSLRFRKLKCTPNVSNFSFNFLGLTLPLVADFVRKKLLANTPFVSFQSFFPGSAPWKFRQRYGNQRHLCKARGDPFFFPILKL